MVKLLDKKIKKGHYFTGLLILSILLFGLNLFYLISPGELSATFLFFGTIAIIFSLAILVVVMLVMSLLKTLKDSY